MGGFPSVGKQETQHSRLPLDAFIRCVGESVLPTWLPRGVTVSDDGQEHIRLETL
jgi:hypothetical protein